METIITAQPLTRIQFKDKLYWVHAWLVTAAYDRLARGYVVEMIPIVSDESGKPPQLFSVLHSSEQWHKYQVVV